MTFNVFRIGRLSPSDADPVAGVEMRSAAVSVASSPQVGHVTRSRPVTLTTDSLVISAQCITKFHARSSPSGQLRNYTTQIVFSIFFSIFKCQNKLKNLLVINNNFAEISEIIDTARALQRQLRTTARIFLGIATERFVQSPGTQKLNDGAHQRLSADIKRIDVIESVCKQFSKLMHV